MPQYRFQIVQRATGGVPRDDIVNSFYLDTETDPLTWGTDEGGLLRDAVDLWRAGTLPLSSRASWISGKAYNMSDATPRAPVAEVSWLASEQSRDVPGPADVAVCLSYYAGRNLPRRRGRMYLGPWPKTHLFDRPAGQLVTGLTALAEGLSGLGGPNVQWVQYSPTTGDFTNVTNYWIDDEWDTQRRRGLKPSARTVGTVSG
jgi:hypothetical protein